MISLRLAASAAARFQAAHFQAARPLRMLALRTYATRRYTPEHEWVSVSNGVGTVGITDYAQKALGDVVFVEVPSVGAVLKRKEIISAVESVKAASDVYAPVGGEVVEVNTKLGDEPSLINTSPYEEGWIAKIKVADETQLDGLLSEEQYAAHIAE
ncbi:glycine cleavage system H protein [Entophlyctis helioformis]|nr:glycine cleavage system H protein [Entophlyctis helioformis]